MFFPIDKWLRDVQMMCETGSQFLENPLNILEIGAITIRATCDSLSAIEESTYE